MPGGGLGEDGPDQGDHPTMSWPMAREATLDRMPQQGQVAQHVHGLVPDRLIRRFEAPWVERFGLTEDHSVIQTSASNESHPPHRRHMALEAKGPRPGKLSSKRPSFQGHGEVLLTDARVIKVDPYIEYGLIGWQKSRPAGSILELKGPEDDGRALGRCLLDKP